MHSDGQHKTRCSDSAQPLSDVLARAHNLAALVSEPMCSTGALLQVLLNSPPGTDLRVSQQPLPD